MPRNVWKCLRGAKGMVVDGRRLGREEEFEAKFQECLNRWDDELPDDLAALYAFIGDAESAFHWIEKMADEGVTTGEEEPLFDSLHDDPRRIPLLERMGTSPAQLAAIDFKVT